MPVKLVKTKHYHVAQKLYEHVRSMPANSKLPTMVELEQQFDTSRTTIERALNRLRKDGIIYRPQGKQRFIVAELHDRAARRIALIRPDYPSQDIDAICRTVVDAGKEINWAFDLISYGDMQMLDIVLACGDNDGVVFLPKSESLPPQLIKALDNPRKPVVILMEHYQQTKACNVSVNDFEVGKMAVEHLCELGHERIAILIDQPHVSSVIQRVKGWKDAMRENGQKNLDDLVIDSRVGSNQDAMVCTYNALAEYLKENPEPEFTAVFNTSAIGAMAALKALDENGFVVPDDMSVIAYAGEATIGPFLKPELTAIEIDMKEYGQKVVDFLNKLLDNEELDSRFSELTPMLVKRQTTAKAGAKVLTEKSEMMYAK